MRSLSIETRHLCLYLGRDNFRRQPLHFILGAILRPNPPQGEFKFRVTLNIFYWHGLRMSACFIPAWMDEPSVVREYERTMH